MKNNKPIQKTIQICIWILSFILIYLVVNDSIHIQEAEQYNQIKMQYEKMEILKFGVVSSLFIMGVLGFIISYFAQRTFKRFGQIKKSIFYLSLFVLISSVWLLANLHFIEPIIQNEDLLHSIEYIGFYIIPITLWCFLEVIIPKKEKIAIVFQKVMMVFFVLALLLRTFFHVDLLMLMPYYCILLIFNIIYIFVVSFPCAFTKMKEQQMIFWGLLSLNLFSMTDLLQCYLLPNNKVHSWVFLLGIYLFIFFLCLSLLYQIKNKIIENMTSEIYKELAYTDIMTKLGNRTKFEENFYHCNKSNKREDITVGVVDINNLKRINDTMGHKVGDDAIRTVSDLLKELFCDIGEIYRIGGDEFVITFIGVSEELISKTFDDFCKRIEDESEKRIYDISVAIGHCSYQPQKHRNLNDLFDSADKIMYENKKQCKQVV